MTERLADISRRVHNVRQLEAVVTAMRGIAASRAQQSRALLTPVRTHAGVIAGAIAEALALLPSPAPRGAAPGTPSLLVLFAAEQGFAGAFNDLMLDAAMPVAGELFLIGSRGAVLAEERGLKPAWQTAMAPHVDGVLSLAERIAAALYERLPATRPARVEMLFPVWTAGRGLAVQRRSLLPLDLARFARPPRRTRPLTTLPAGRLLEQLAEEYVYAELCEAALSAFAAENEARVAAMVAAKANIGRILEGLVARERAVRQEEITAEVVELAAGAAAVT